MKTQQSVQRTHFGFSHFGESCYFSRVGIEGTELKQQLPGQRGWIKKRGERGKGQGEGELDHYGRYYPLPVTPFPCAPCSCYHFTVPSFVVSISACSLIGSDSLKRNPLMLSNKKFCASGLVRSNP